MAALYVRFRSQDRWVNMVHSIDEFRDLIDAYFPGTPLVIGDYSTFDGRMKSMLLKFIEDNPEVSVYSSEDVPDAILLSRFPNIEKVPLQISPYHDDASWANAKRDYANVVALQSSCPTDIKLRMPLISRKLEDLLKSL